MLRTLPKKSVTSTYREREEEEEVTWQQIHCMAVDEEEGEKGGGHMCSKFTDSSKVWQCMKMGERESVLYPVVV